MPTIEEIFEEMPKRLNVEQASSVNMKIGFDLSGEEAGAWLLTVAGGEATTSQGSAEGADATIKMDSEDYKKMVTGALNPMTAFMTGKVKVDGDLSSVMKMQTLFNL